MTYFADIPPELQRGPRPLLASHFLFGGFPWIFCFCIFFRRLGNLVAGILGVLRGLFDIVVSLLVADEFEPPPAAASILPPPKRA